MSDSQTIRMLCLDVAINVTGYAAFVVEPGQSFSFRLIDIGNIVNDDSVTMDTDSRVRSLLASITSICYKHESNCLIVEEPPQTIYGGKFVSKDAIIGRAAKMFKVVSAAYGVVGHCFAAGLFCRTVEPNQWQRGGPKRDKMDSKVWSTKEANKVISYLKYNYKGTHAKLKTKEEANIADAINIGIHTIRCFNSKVWEIPKFSDGTSKEPMHV